jgi:hypothetical protein
MWVMPVEEVPMEGSYEVNFSTPTPIVDGNKQITGFSPKVDRILPFSVPPLHFGKLNVGSSTAPQFAGPPVLLDDGGLLVGVYQNPADMPTPTHVPAPESRALYVVHPSLFTLSNFGWLRAEVVFDLPGAVPASDVPPNANASDYAWGVSVVLKPGNQDETTTPPIRTSCQFFSGGLINFHGTDYQHDPLNTDPMFDPYQETVQVNTYRGYGDTEFRVSMMIARRQGSNGIDLRGIGTLRIGDSIFSGNLTIDHSKVPDINTMTALGFSVVCKQNRLPWIHIRAKQFTITLSSPHIPTAVLTTPAKPF